MIINFFLIGLTSQKNFEVFFKSIKGIQFYFQEYKNLKKFKEKNNLIFLSNTFKKNVNLEIDKINSKNFKNECYFVPNSLLDFFKDESLRLIPYPIRVGEFENRLKNYFSDKKFNFKNIELINGNILTNNRNKKTTYLTEIESKIIKFMFINKKSSKQKINSKILSQQPSVESKTLEAHLYRLRKKINKIDSNLKILPIGEKSIKITYSNSTKD